MENKQNELLLAEYQEMQKKLELIDEYLNESFILIMNERSEARTFIERSVERCFHIYNLDAFEEEANKDCSKWAQLLSFMLEHLEKKGGVLGILPESFRQGKLIHEIFHTEDFYEIMYSIFSEVSTEKLREEIIAFTTWLYVINLIQRRVRPDLDKYKVTDSVEEEGMEQSRLSTIRESQIMQQIIGGNAFDIPICLYEDEITEIGKVFAPNLNIEQLYYPKPETIIPFEWSYSWDKLSYLIRILYCGMVKNTQIVQGAKVPPKVWERMRLAFVKDGSHAKSLKTKSWPMLQKTYGVGIDHLIVPILKKAGRVV